MKRVLVLLALVAAMVQAQDASRQSLRIIVPFPPGASADVVTRLLAEELKATLGHPVLVENRSGATGRLGVGALARAPADGYTIGVGNESTHVTVPLLKGKVAYDPVKDFTPLTLAVRTTMAIAVNPALLPVNTLAELIELAKTRPVPFGTPGEGSPQQLIGQLLVQRTGGRFVHEPHPGAAAAAGELAEGRVAMAISTLPALVAHQDKVRILAIGDAVRLPGLPTVPTIAETLPDVVVTGWLGYFAPANVPPAVAAKISAALQAALHKPAVVEALRKQSLSPAGSPPEELGGLVRVGLDLWGPVIGKAQGRARD